MLLNSLPRQHCEAPQYENIHTPPPLQPRSNTQPHPTLTLSNSSIQQIPLSASMSAPASTQNSPVSASRTTEAVRPAAEDDLPGVRVAGVQEGSDQRVRWCSTCCSGRSQEPTHVHGDTEQPTEKLALMLHQHSSAAMLSCKIFIAAYAVWRSGYTSQSYLLTHRRCIRSAAGSHARTSRTDSSRRTGRRQYTRSGPLSERCPRASSCAPRRRA